DDKKGEPPPPAKPAEGKLCLKLEIKPKKKDVPPPKVLERSFLAVNSPAVRLPPGSLVRISAFVFIPEPITASLDGALLYGSAGGRGGAGRRRGGRAAGGAPGRTSAVEEVHALPPRAGFRDGECDNGADRAGGGVLRRRSHRADALGTDGARRAAVRGGGHG